MSAISHFRKPELVKAKDGWYIKYYYRIPHDVRHLYDDKEWYRFRVKLDINKRKGSDRAEYAAWLLDQITSSLKKGYNPFKPDQEIFEADAFPELPAKQEINATDALLLFLEKWREKGLEEYSYKKYERYIGRLIEWLKIKRIPYIELSRVTEDHIEQFLADMKKKNDFSNREYNNHYDFIRTAFNFFVKKKFIAESPCAGISKLKTKASKHRFYDKVALEQITRALQTLDPYMYIVFQAVYYLCVRSDKELQHLKVGNVMWEQNKILVEVSKTDQNYIPMDDHIKAILKDYIKDAPAEYYIFGPNGEPSPIKFSHGLLAKKFQRVRDRYGMDKAYTLYGAKHTRVIHLKQDGATDADIMSLTRHRDYTAYAKYLRDLGMDADAAKFSRLSRKV